MILCEHFGEFIRRNQNSIEEWVGWLASGEHFLCTQITKFLQLISIKVLLGWFFVLGTGDTVLDMVGNIPSWWNLSSLGWQTKLETNCYVIHCHRIIYCAKRKNQAKSGPQMIEMSPNCPGFNFSYKELYEFYFHRN